MFNTTPRPDDSRHDRLYKEGCALIDGLILLHGQDAAELDAPSRKRLEDAIPLFEEVLAINPRNWPALWLLGKVSQRLENYERGLDYFARAHHLRPDQPDVAREASIAAMDLGRHEEAIAFCESALRAEADDPGLRANLALALLFADRPAEAKEVASEALKRDPTDEITARIVGIVDEVLAGTRPCPHHVHEVE